MKSNRKIIRFFIMVFLLAVGVFLSLHKHSSSPRELCYQSHCFTLEIVDTPASMERGLMFRKSLPAHYGMLFVFQDISVHDFWMKNTLIPLDMVWLDKNFTVVDIKHAIPCIQDPCSIYHPQGPSSYVVEFAGGTTKTIGLSEGAQMIYK